MLLPPNPELFLYIRLTALWSMMAALYSVRNGLCWQNFFLSLNPLQCFWIISAAFSSISRLYFCTSPKKMTDTITIYSLLCFLKCGNQNNNNNLTVLLFFQYYLCSKFTILQWCLRLLERKAFLDYATALQRKDVCSVSMQETDKRDENWTIRTTWKKNVSTWQESHLAKQTEKGKCVYVLIFYSMCFKLLFNQLHQWLSLYFLEVNQHAAWDSQ